MKLHKSFIPPIGMHPHHHKISKTDSEIAKKDFTSHFQEALSKTETNLTISKHAKQRLQQRNIEISSDHWQKINAKVDEAKQMGVNESLVLLDNAALIVSAKNKTVITALDRNEAQSQIFTNINGTIII